MRGHDVFMQSLSAHGADAIFGNPGTTENPLLDNLARHSDITYYTALHEGVAVCAAGFYAQASGKTAVASLHVAPGLGNAIGMMYGALKAASPVVVTAGQQDTRFRLREPILSHDLVAMAAPVSKWAGEVRHADEMAHVMQRAFRIAREAPAGPVFVGLPNNVMEQETANGVMQSGPLYTQTPPDPAGIKAISELLLKARNPAIFAGDEVAQSGAVRQTTALAEQLGATVYMEYLHARQPIAINHPCYGERIPYTAGLVHSLLEPHDAVLLLGGPFVEEVWFDNQPLIPAHVRVAQIESAPQRLAFNFELDAGVQGNLALAVDDLLAGVKREQSTAGAAAAKSRLEELGNRSAAAQANYRQQLLAPAAGERMTTGFALAEVAKQLPADAIVVDESITAALDVQQAFLPSGADDYFAGRGGGIGQGVAGALGVAAAQANRQIVAVSGDGSAMYSIQALWTAARHELNILFVILSNREYRVLKHNLDAHRKRFDEAVDRPYPLMDLTHPDLGFVEMANGMGVAGARAENATDIAAAMALAGKTAGPFLLELAVSGKAD